MTTATRHAGRIAGAFAVLGGIAMLAIGPVSADEETIRADRTGTADVGPAILDASVAPVLPVHPTLHSDPGPRMYVEELLGSPRAIAMVHFDARSFPSAARVTSVVLEVDDDSLRPDAESTDAEKAVIRACPLREPFTDGVAARYDCDSAAPPVLRRRVAGGAWTFDLTSLADAVIDPNAYGIALVGAAATPTSFSVALVRDSAHARAEFTTSGTGVATPDDATTSADTIGAGMAFSPVGPSTNGGRGGDTISAGGATAPRAGVSTGAAPTSGSPPRIAAATRDEFPQWPRWSVVALPAFCAVLAMLIDPRSLRRAGRSAT